MAGRHEKVLTAGLGAKSQDETRGGDAGSQASGEGARTTESKSDDSTSSGNSSPAGSPGGNPKIPRWEAPATEPRGSRIDMSYLYPFQAEHWGQLGSDLAIRLERVALRLRVKRQGWQGEEGAVMDTHELKSAWDKMVRAVQADDDLGCLFDTGRASSTE